MNCSVAAAFFDDAGIGKDLAGVGRLAILDPLGTPGLAYAHDSARIGDALDAWTSGIVSVVNEAAAAKGARAGQTVRDACGTIARAIGRGER